jgi:hypothetical protein
MHAPPVGPGRAGTTVYLSLHADTEISNISGTSMLRGMKMVDHDELLRMVAVGTITNETTLGLLGMPQQDRPWLRNPRELLLSTIEVRATFPVYPAIKPCNPGGAALCHAPLPLHTCLLAHGLDGHVTSWRENRFTLPDPTAHACPPC